MDSTGFYRQRIGSALAIILLGTALTACTSSPNLAFSAPRSTVARETALHLAKQVAADIGGKVYAVAPSGSMVPTLDEGSIVTVEKVTFDKLNRGDIVIYRNGSGTVVIHRLYEKHDHQWFVLGDHNSSIDRDTVSRENLLGRVCAIFYTAANATLATTLTEPPAALASRE